MQIYLMPGLAVHTFSLQIWRREFNESIIDFSRFDDAHLSRAELRNALVNETRFNRSNLSHANFTGAILFGRDIHTESRFNRANMSNANLQRARISSTRFDQANLNNANLSGVVFHGDVNRFQYADLRGVDFTGSINQSHLNFQYADLRGADLHVLGIMSHPLHGPFVTFRYSNASGAIVHPRAMDVSIWDDAICPRSSGTGRRIAIL